MKNLPLLDISIIAIYLIAMLLAGIYFSKKNSSSDQYSKASELIPGWAIGLSIYASFLSSNTFLGVPAKAFGSNWNAFVFSISMPLAAWIAAKYFVPFYRKTGEVSAKSVWLCVCIFSGGMLRLFLPGIISKKSGNPEAIAATVTGIMVIIWLSLSNLISTEYAYLKNPLHANMAIVIGTMVIFLVGSLLTKLKTVKQQLPQRNI